MTGHIVGGIDAAQFMVAVFVLFFVGLVWHLRQEDKREGYPMISPGTEDEELGFPAPPHPKIFRHMQGGITLAPREEPPDAPNATPLFPFPGAPLVATGDPMADRIGPASVGGKRDEPLVYQKDKIQVLPMRTLEGWRLSAGDPDPRGMTVVDGSGHAVGRVTDVWIDRSVKILRYLELEIDGPDAHAALMPIYYADISARRGRVKAIGISAARLAAAPMPRTADRITAREEDEVSAYYSGALYFDRRFRSRTAL